jgi:anaerobic C4-dicarboxylate transporter
MRDTITRLYATNAAMFEYIFSFVIDILIIYITSFLFFTLEPLIQLYITDKDSPESKEVQARVKTATIKDKFRDIENYGERMGNRRLTHSILFQAALLVIAYYAITSSTERVGIGLALALYLQTIVDQILLLNRGQTLDTWLWQLNVRLNKNIQLVYVIVVSLLFVILVMYRF